VQTSAGRNDDASRGSTAAKGRFGKTGGSEVPNQKGERKKKLLASGQFGGVPNAKYARDIAKFYYETYGLVVIPVPVGQKAPVIKWAEIKDYEIASKYFYKAKGSDKWWPDEDDVTEPIGIDEINYACLCGPSDVVVIDFDDKELAERNKIDTLTVQTPKGTHYYIRIEDASVGNMSFHSQGTPVDIRGEGGVAILPPSIGASPYRLEDTYPIRSFPYTYFTRYLNEVGISIGDTEGVKNEPGWFAKEFIAQVVKGARDETCTKLAGYLLNGNLTPEDVCEILNLWAIDRTIPTFMDVEKCVYSVARKEARNAETTEAEEDTFESDLNSEANNPDNPFS
jgi:hypothetical protein